MTTNDNSKTGSLSTSLVTRVLFGMLGCTALIYSGCAMCCGPQDYHYPTHGGAVQRQDPVWGRVGSVFSDPGPFGGPSADYNLTPHEVGSISSPFESDDNLNLDLEPLDADGESNLNPPEGLNGSDTRSGGDILPAPREETPGPDETTQIRRRRNQSRRGAPRSRWR